MISTVVVAALGAKCSDCCALEYSSKEETLAIVGRPGLNKTAGALHYSKLALVLIAPVLGSLTTIEPYLLLIYPETTRCWARWTGPLLRCIS